MPDGISFILVGDGQGRVVYDLIYVYLPYIIEWWIFLFLPLSSFFSSSSSGLDCMLMYLVDNI